MRDEVDVETDDPVEAVLIRVRRQHVRLSALFDEVEELAKSALEDVDRVPTLTDRIGSLRNQFLGHLSYEEEHFAPLLQEQPDWGKAAADDMVSEHKAQRADLEALVSDSKALHAEGTVAKEALALVHQIRRDMADEDAKIAMIRAARSGA